MFANLFLRRGIAARVLRPGILILLAFCFLAHAGGALAAGPASRSVDLLSPPASAPDLVAACAQAQPLQECGSASWPLPPCPYDPAAIRVPSGDGPKPEIVERLTSKAQVTPVLPRPPPLSLFS
ncbi:hypothetical protein [Geoalkalibacter halelectricus]|uniref:hypothetical protein n=1 Tax=Geoalkalibacter halelectricus TaxID=2847045 RepID=UPI003D22EDB8